MLAQSRQHTPHSAWWPPLSFVVVALVLLLVTPLVVDHYASRLRDDIVNGSDRGRVLVNDLEAGFANELLDGRESTLGIEGRTSVLADERELSVVMERVGPDAVSRFDSLEALLTEWKQLPHSDPGDAATDARARRIFNSAESLDRYLDARSQQQRHAARRLQRMNVLAAIILAPIALIAMLVVVRSGRRLARYASEADRQRAEVLRTAESRTALLRGVTHDVKNPLGAAAGYAELLEEGILGPLNEQQSEVVQRIRRLASQAVDTISDLLELARADSGLQLEYSRTDLAMLARETVDDHAALAVEHGLCVEVQAEPTIVVTDARRVRQVLANLVSNAIKYTPEGGHVTVHLVRDDSQRTGLVVRDTGPGIPAELRSRVFEEFFRVREANATSGNGLGLAISRRIAQLLGGDVTYAPNEGGGSVFTLWLAATEHSPERHPVDAQASAGSSELTRIGSRA